MQNAEKISITMTPDMLRMVRESVEAGEYAPTSEVLRDAVRLNALRSRVRRSLGDTQPDLSLEEVDARLSVVHASTVNGHGDT